ncbi:hypothetical protein [Hymenobacter coalescens]
MALALVACERKSGQQLPRQSTPHETGVKLYAQQRYADAAVVFASLCLREPRNADAHYRAGICYGLAGRYAEANQYLSSAKALGKQAPIDRQLAANYFYTHQMDSARRYIARALAAAPGDEKAQLLAKLIEAPGRR